MKKSISKWLLLALTLSLLVVCGGCKPDANHQPNKDAASSAQESGQVDSFKDILRKYTDAYIFGKAKVFLSVISKDLREIDANGVVASRSHIIHQVRVRDEVTDLEVYKASSVKIKKVEIGWRDRLAIVWADWYTKVYNVEDEKTYEGSSPYIFVLKNEIIDEEKKIGDRGPYKRAWKVLSVIHFVKKDNETP